MHNWPLIKDVMDKRLITLKATMKISEASDILVKEKSNSAPVVDSKGKLVGILSEKDCLKSFLHSAYHKTPDGMVADYMTRNTITITGSMDIMTAAQLFLNHDFRRLPVLEDSRLVGHVTRLDLLRKIQQLGGIHSLAS